MTSITISGDVYQLTPLGWKGPDVEGVELLRALTEANYREEPSNPDALREFIAETAEMLGADSYEVAVAPREPNVVY
jgi:hypothetical protein